MPSYHYYDIRRFHDRLIFIMAIPIQVKQHRDTELVHWSVFQLCVFHADGLLQDCGDSGALAMDLLQSCIKPST